MTEPRAEVVLPCLVEGSTWDGFSVSLSSTGTSLAEPLASAVMEFKDSARAVVLTLDVGSGIAITDGAAWALDVAAITPFPLSPGTYTATLKMTNDTGTIRKWIKFSQSVIPD